MTKYLNHRVNNAEIVDPNFNNQTYKGVYDDSSLGNIDMRKNPRIQVEKVDTRGAGTLYV